jgi:hypothetical protein
VVTHNSFSIVDAPPLPGVQRLTFYNQEDAVTNQLRVCAFFSCCLSFHFNDALCCLVFENLVERIREN